MLSVFPQNNKNHAQWVCQSQRSKYSTLQNFNKDVCLLQRDSWRHLLSLFGNYILNIRPFEQLPLQQLQLQWTIQYSTMLQHWDSSYLQYIIATTFTPGILVGIVVSFIQLYSITILYNFTWTDEISTKSLQSTG